MAESTTTISNINDFLNTFKIVEGSNLPAQDAPIKGLGFHKFDGKTDVDEVIHQIGADFSVGKQHLVRIPDNVYDMIMNSGSEACVISKSDLIGSHMATYDMDNDKTIGVVGADYGIIQNSEALDILKVITNSEVTGEPMRIVSAGLVHDFEPYVQVSLPSGGRINGDDSPTDFYAFIHTSHDGTSSLKVSFSAIRVVCSNTFMANMRSIGFSLKHTSKVGQRVDMTQEANIKRVREFVAQTNVFRTDYIEKMNVLASKPVTATDINDFAMRMFIPAEFHKDVTAHNYRLDEVETVSTRAKNQIEAFRNVLESGAGQNTNRGSRLWLFNGLTNYYSNVARYGSTKDDTKTAATKRFDSLSAGQAMRKANEALAVLVA